MSHNKERYQSCTNILTNLLNLSTFLLKRLTECKEIKKAGGIPAFWSENNKEFWKETAKAISGYINNI